MFTIGVVVENKQFLSPPSNFIYCNGFVKKIFIWFRNEELFNDRTTNVELVTYFQKFGRVEDEELKKDKKFGNVSIYNNG